MKIKTPISWIGNKTPILHILYALFPLEYERYIEPFGGSGAVLLGKPWIDKFEVYNDYNRNLVNLFRCMRERPHTFIQNSGFLNLNSRDDFKALKQIINKEDFSDGNLEAELEASHIILPEPVEEEITELYTTIAKDYDMKRAVTYLKLLRYSYSSSGKSFGCQPFSIRSLFSLIQQVSKRLDNAVIENQDFQVLIKHYDRPDAFIYCDPPYFSSEYVYDCGFTMDDHIRLHDTLKSAQGKWLLSYNDCPEIRELYKDCEIFDFSRIHSMVQKFEAGKEFQELLIGNYDIFEREKSKPMQLQFFKTEEEIIKEKIKNEK